MVHRAVCRNCGSRLDLRERPPVQSLVYRHVACPTCGKIAILEGPQANVVYERIEDPEEPGRRAPPLRAHPRRPGGIGEAATPGN